MLYQILSRLLPQTAIRPKPRRIVLIRPCCIGDAVMATAALTALRNAFPRAHIVWAVGPWSAPAIRHHPAIDAILDCEADMPLQSPSMFWRFVRRLRAGDFDLAVSLMRSPLTSLAVLLAGIPVRAGLDSGGRGFGYNLRVPLDSAAREHESEIYLKVVSAIAGEPLRAYANLPVSAATRTAVLARLSRAGIAAPFIVAHPGGGSNPGAQLASKRYPAPLLAELLNRVAAARGASVILIGAAGDADLAGAVAAGLTVPPRNWVNRLSFTDIGALAAGALLYIGNDTGVTHLAAASGAKTVMIMGPTDPKRYAPYTADQLALWKAVDLRTGGAARAEAAGWDWQRDGISVAEAVAAINTFLGAT